jgi:hypothetical protein
LAPEHSGGNIDVDCKTTSLSSTDRLKNALPCFNTTFHGEISSLLEEGTLDGDKVFGRCLTHEMIQEINADKDVVIHGIVALDIGFNDLKRNLARFLDNDLMLIIPISARPRIACAKSLATGGGTGNSLRNIPSSRSMVVTRRSPNEKATTDQASLFPIKLSANI